MRLKEQLLIYTLLFFALVLPFSTRTVISEYQILGTDIVSPFTTATLYVIDIAAALVIISLLSLVLINFSAKPSYAFLFFLFLTALQCY